MSNQAINPNVHKIEKLFSDADFCINLVGILYESKKGNTFQNIHSVFPSLLAKLCRKYNLEHFLHISALGINEASDSKYAISKLEGEKNIFKNFSKSTILRPSVVFSNSDNFSTQFMTLLNRLPIFPLYYSGKTKFMPIHCTDLTNIIYHLISKGSETKIIECVGPEILTFKEMLEILLNLINKKRLLLPFPLAIAKLSAKFFQLFPKPLLTEDQLRLLKYDNIPSGKYKTNSDIGLPSKLYFKEEVKKYSYMWRDGGEFSKEKYNFGNPKKN